MIDDDDLDEHLRAWGRARREQSAEVDVRATLARSLDPLDRQHHSAGARGSVFAVRSVLICAAVVLLVVAGGVAVRSLRTQGAQPASTQKVNARALVLRDGDTVRVNGDVLAVPKKPVQLCAPHLDALVGVRDTQFTDCPTFVDVTGVDLSALSDRQVSHGTVSGAADLTGIYRAGKVTVTRQAPLTPDPIAPADRVPCPAPAGGWPSGATDENIDLTAAEQYQHAHPGTIIELALLRPSQRQTVAYILTDGDPTPVRAALTATFGKRLCVTHSKWTRAQLKATLAAMYKQLKNPNPLATADSVGEGLTTAGQLEVTVGIPTVSPALADLVDAQPPGIVSLDVWLAPQR